jgi:hypothetical protein
MIAIFHDLIVSDFCDFWRIDDNYDRRFSLKNHEKENSELKTIKIFVEDCSIFDFQFL